MCNWYCFILKQYCHDWISVFADLSWSKQVFNFRPNNSLAGEFPICKGNRATLSLTDPFQSFLRPCLSVCTTLSAKPFEDGWYVMSHIPFLVRNCLNSALTKQKPLSVTTVCGIPNRANVVQTFSIVALEVDEAITCTSIHSEWASTMIRNMCPKNTPAKSKWILDHWHEGHSHECRGATGGLKRQLEQHWTFPFIFLSKLGH